MEGELTAWMQAWWKAHPKATFNELEAEVDRQVAVLRAEALQATLAAGGGMVEEPRAAGEVCPVCGTTMVKMGRHLRKLKTKGEQVIEIDREYLRCPRCGNGFFPPGP